ncbi:MAG: Signal recognition particle receptor FtsY [Myxococcota bacterium]|nr:Signal recognition particle receptor FtsY [Myxococcota bacterium]
MFEQMDAINWVVIAAFVVLVIAFIWFLFGKPDQTELPAPEKPKPLPPEPAPSAPPAADEQQAALREEPARAPAEAEEEAEVTIPPEAVVPASPPPAPAVEAPPEPAPRAEPAPTPPRKKSLKEGLAKTQEGLISRIRKVIFGKPELDAKVLDELEEVLYTADVGVKTVERLLDVVRDRLNKKELNNAQAVQDAIKEEMERMLEFEARPISWDSAKPYVIMVVGVNGVGKTTTIGKLASKLREEGKTVVLGAGDTFRAAAVEQLKIWGERAGCEVHAMAEGADPAAVSFDAVKAGVEKKADVVICDTAGRLHTKTPLMEELRKVHRVMGKAHEGAPHEVWLVLDATNGQNAVQQARQFNEMLNLTGIVLTKLDGTAKGGVILQICNELKAPIRYIGIGESKEDLQEFHPREFIDALFS